MSAGSERAIPLETVQAWTEEVKKLIAEHKIREERLRLAGCSDMAAWHRGVIAGLESALLGFDLETMKGIYRAIGS